ncbi:UVI-1h [Colletotrichum higginsianum]|uniref:UVI-1h n=2 Tax=Colletotrichum higginsianum TaxID=80884 RepID=H1VZE6_COLHI|nr:UVI-1h [Colletotrichum higginsianum IMI 349063]OBR14013.1 UVI-1h [Colletotrichum higginsianum IMI 349063]TID02569.1 hypothetical protein CH35J_004181 [Colletotrichum higginsianum]CCF45608.1 UVI-1h [Colletotrichum higginsianum]
MRFSILKAAVAALAVCNDVVLGQFTPAQVVMNIEVITTKSQALIAPAQNINLISGALLIIGQGPFPKIIAGFTDIVTTAGVALVQMRGMPPVPAGAQSDAIFEAFRTFVKVHQQLLNVLIGKAGLFTTIPIVGEPVAVVLRAVEDIVDTVAFALIDAVQSRAKDLEAELDSLTGTIQTATKQYSGIQL